MRSTHFAAALICAAGLTGTNCGKQTPPIAHAAATQPRPSAEELSPDGRKLVRATGTIQAVHYVGIQVPQIQGATGQNGRVTLTKLVAGGSQVKTGDVIAEFDRTQQLDNARDAKAKYDDLGHQVEQRAAQNRADAAERMSDLRSAEGDLAKAELELRKGPLLSEIDRLKAQVKRDIAREQVASLTKSDGAHDRADAAALRVLELQRDRQKVTLDRALRSAEKLQLKAPLSGMVALENVWRNGSMGHPQEGDQLWSGQTIMKIFDPSLMEVRADVGEPDGAVVGPGSRATVRLDAYPGMVFNATFKSASPVASSVMGSPIKTFTAMFKLDKNDPHLLPDLSAAVLIEATGAARDLYGGNPAVQAGAHPGQEQNRPAAEKTSSKGGEADRQGGAR